MRHTRTILALVVAAIAAGCGFSSRAAQQCGPTSAPDWISCMLNHAPYHLRDSDSRKTVYEAPGLIRVRHGRSCVAVEAATNGSSIGFRIQDQEAVPLALADSGTVFMNGWELRYTQADHHVQGLGSAIVNIATTRSGDDLLLNWEAGGVLTDENGDDPYEWCYTYTIVFWNRSSSGFDAVAARTGQGFMETTGSDPGNDTALRRLNGSGITSYGQGVVLPQGFALMYGDSDHHIIQVGMDYGEHSSVASGEIAWTSRTVLKDNDERHDYYGGELVSVLGYSSPQSFHPQAVLRETQGGWTLVDNAVSLAPQASQSFCNPIGDPTGEAHYKVLNVPFQYAVPVLKGWELGYLCTDHHVREIGASITDFRYERDPYSNNGTLYYTLSMKLHDDEGNLNYAGASIDILGMNARGPAPHPLNSADVVVPRVPLGCTFGNLSLADGQSVDAYLAPHSALCEACEVETRVCHDGVLSGSYSAPSCTATRPRGRQQCP